MSFERQIEACIAQITLKHNPALKQLYQLTSGRLYGLLVKMTNDQELAAEALQDAFTKIWFNAAQYRPDLGTAWPWMCQIARNAALDLLRQHQRQPALLNDEQWAQLNEATIDSSRQWQQNADLNRCLAQLRKEPRQAIIQAYLYGLSHSELAAYWQLPLGTLKSWIRRGLKELEQCLKA